MVFFRGGDRSNFTHSEVFRTIQLWQSGIYILFICYEGILLIFSMLVSQVISGKSVLIYAKGVDQLNYNAISTKFNMPNTFNTWFLITEIHVWMLMVRAMAERDRGQLIRNNIVESMWSDALERSKIVAPDDSRIVKKQIHELSGQFQYAIVSYDEGLTKDDKQLASALWKRFFNSNCDNYEHIELMVKYVRINVSEIAYIFNAEEKRDFNN